MFSRLSGWVGLSVAAFSTVVAIAWVRSWVTEDEETDEADESEQRSCETNGATDAASSHHKQHGGKDVDDMVETVGQKSKSSNGSDNDALALEASKRPMLSEAQLAQIFEAVQNNGQPNYGNGALLSPASAGAYAGRRSQRIMSLSEKRDLDMMFRVQEHKEGRPTSNSDLDKLKQARQRKSHRKRVGDGAQAVSAADDDGTPQLSLAEAELLELELTEVVAPAPQVSPKSNNKKRTRRKPKQPSQVSPTLPELREGFTPELVSFCISADATPEEPIATAEDSGEVLAVSSIEGEEDEEGEPVADEGLENNDSDDEDEDEAQIGNDEEVTLQVEVEATGDVLEDEQAGMADDEGKIMTDLVLVTGVDSTATSDSAPAAHVAVEETILKEFSDTADRKIDTSARAQISDVAVHACEIGNNANARGEHYISPRNDSTTAPSGSPWSRCTGSPGLQRRPQAWADLADTSDDESLLHSESWCRTKPSGETRDSNENKDSQWSAMPDPSEAAEFPEPLNISPKESPELSGAQHLVVAPEPESTPEPVDVVHAIKPYLVAEMDALEASIPSKMPEEGWMKVQTKRGARPKRAV